MYFPIQHLEELVGSMKIGEMKKLRHLELFFNVPKVISRKLQKGLKPRPSDSALYYAILLYSLASFALTHK